MGAIGSRGQYRPKGCSPAALATTMRSHERAHRRHRWVGLPRLVAGPPAARRAGRARRCRTGRRGRADPGRPRPAARRRRRRRPRADRDRAARRCARRRGRRRVPPRRGGQRRGRGRLRPGHADQHRRDARRAGVRPPAHRGPAGGVHQLAGGVRQRSRDRSGRRRGRRHPAPAAVELRDPEVRRRAAGGRLHAQGLRARPVGPPDDGVGTARTAERRGVGLPVRDHPRTARRGARPVPGRSGHPGGAVVAPAQPGGASCGRPRSTTRRGAAGPP